MARGTKGPYGGMPPGVRPLTVGDPVIVGPYLLLGRLGSGGMGVVYLAEHPRGGFVAVKTPHIAHLPDATLRARFGEEMELSRRVTPFQTAAVVEHGIDRDRPYLVTEYIPGPALSQVIDAGGPLPLDLAYGVALAAAAALVAVHEAGLVHRDLKPGNVLLSPSGPYVIDFGIAVDVDTAAAHTEAGQIMGSPGWVAPERLTGGRALPPSDVFSWGCLVAYAATGHHPFGGGETDVLTRRILVEEPRIAAVPKLLWSTVAAALAKEPADRPDAEELLGALLAAGGVGAPWDVREAVAEVLSEIWQPVPYPRGSLPEPSSVAASPRTRHGGPVSRSRVPHAGFAALAAMSVAVLAVVASGTGRVNTEATEVSPERMPYVVPDTTGPPDPGRVLGVSRRPSGRMPSGRAGGAFAPGSPRPAAVTSTRPPGSTLGGGEPGESRSPVLPHPDPSGSKPARTPPRDGDVPDRCEGRRGRPKPCDGPSTSATGFPSPTGSVSQIPGWGDEESPMPTVTQAPAPSPSA